jgi:undecaprenyl diphosphate synthase
MKYLLKKNKKFLRYKVQAKKMPKHIALIPDGNGRWAEKRNKHRSYGHEKGAQVIWDFIQWSLESGVEELSIFALSCENFSRGKKELTFILDLLHLAIRKRRASLKESKISVQIMGDISVFPRSLQHILQEIEQDTDQEKSKMQLNIALNYSGRWHIATMVKSLLVKNPKPQHLNQEIARFMGAVSEPDLLIRTGGERRVSNFMLWHFGYTEVYFSDLLWPDFNKDAFSTALLDYMQRERRFGLVGCEEI